MIDQVTALLGEETVDVDRSALLKLTLGEKLMMLIRLDNEIIEIMPEAELEEEIQQCDEYKEKFTMLWLN